MHQQVNLFHPMFRRERKVFSAAALLQICVLAVLAMGALYGYERWQLGTTDQALAALRTQHTRLQRQLAQQQPPPKPKTTQALDARIAALNKQLKARRDLVQRIDTLVDANSQGFAPPLKALARIHVPGLWLTGLTIDHPEATIELRGVALRPKLVPGYLQRLPGQAAFRNVHFQTVELKRDPDHHGRLDFVLRSAPGPAAVALVQP